MGRQYILSYTFEEYCERVEAFHGALAPGILVGGFMVDLARHNLPPGTLFDVICETVECLPDAVQLLTPCSVGNQWMKIIDVGRFALTLYDKDTGEGVRVHLDSRKLERWPAINEWLMKLKPKKQQDRDRLVREIKEAGTDIRRFISIMPALLSFPGRLLKLSTTIMKSIPPAAGGEAVTGSPGNLPTGLKDTLKKASRAPAG